MRQKGIMGIPKKICVILLLIAMIATGISNEPMLSSASETVGTVTTDNGIKYVPCDMASYWSTSEKKAPVMDNYVFGGWYIAEDVNAKKFIALKPEAITTDTETGKANVEGTYAKFVSAYVLSVKAQIDVITEEAGAERTNTASIRLISSVDSKDYQKVGFEVLLANETPLYKDEERNPLETTKVYTGLKKGESGTRLEPSAIFGPQSKFLSVWRLDGIASANDDKIINVKPYWITADGTRVDGLAKYVHVEDGYMGYISVPINLRSAKQIAAGTLTLTYPEGLEFVANKVEYDGVFPTAEMLCNDDGKSEVRFVGNVSATLDGENNVDAMGIYANVRFKKGSLEYTGGNGEFLEFKVNDENFCKWNEEEVFIDAWNVQY